MVVNSCTPLFNTCTMSNNLNTQASIPMKNVYNTYIWLYIVQLFVVKKTRSTMLYKSVHHLELAVQGIIKPKKNPPSPQTHY